MAQVDNQQFTTAEERIVYNKANGINKYEGVLIEYVYLLNDEFSITPEQSEDACSSLFTKYVTSTMYEDQGSTYLVVLTEGDRANHDFALELERKFEFKLAVESRKYHLIPTND